MDPTVDIDWTMGSRAAQLVDWHTAIDLAKTVSGSGPKIPPGDRVRMRDDLAAHVDRAEGLVTGFTGLDVTGPRSRAWVMGRGNWARQNIQGLQRMLEPLAARILDKRPDRGAVSRKALGGQIGAILGYVSRRVLGQFDVFLPPDDEGLIYFVGPNLVDVERRFSLPPADFRLWVAIHEVTHRVQFDAAPWLRGYLAGLVDEYLATVSLEPGELKAQLKRAADELQAGAEVRGPGGLLLLLTPEQRAIFERTQSMMSLLEGHASYVMNEVAKDHVHDLPRLRRALAARRSTKGVEKAFQRAIAFDQKVAQYDAGERFVREVVARSGQDGLNAVWATSANLPTQAEVAEPARWVARVGG
ncbi:MAG TPA: zinc-dependent metalloprotease [Actinomycetota bacterium]